MAIDLTELESLRDALIRARAKGLRVAQIGAERIEYKTDAEMVTALEDIEARIRRTSTTPARAVTFSSSKGF